MSALPTALTIAPERSFALRSIAAMNDSAQFDGWPSPGTAVPERTACVKVDQRFQRCAVCSRAGRALSRDPAVKKRALAGVLKKVSSLLPRSFKLTSALRSISVARALAWILLEIWFAQAPEPNALNKSSSSAVKTVRLGINERVIS